MYIHDRIDPNDRFRERRRRARRRRRIRRAAAAVALVGMGGAFAGGATYFTTRTHHAQAAPAAAGRRSQSAVPAFRSRLPAEIRGVHVTEGLASIPGKFEEYVALSSRGLNTVELDVKDERGYVGFVGRGLPALARAVGAARPFYDPVRLVRVAHRAGLYVIGRVVVFQDPTLTRARPDLAIQRRGGGVWTNAGGLGWANEYDPRVWKYDVDVAVAAARAGFDEIQFDYVRFPTDGDLSTAVFPHRRAEPKGVTIDRFFRYAVGRLHPLHVRVSADLFGLAATRDLGIGQVPRRAGRLLDTIYPMVYPSHYNRGEYNLIDPEAFPYATVVHALRDFRRQTRGEQVRLVPWLQDFTLRVPYGPEQVVEQIDAARTMGAAGFMLWNPEGVYTAGVLARGSS
ncbi:MAG TPA: putative glycoside hydrolase [Gaiellaceae bacterium]|nr:putative glycoside hydrolase [Gaiellaceae bacterium]